MEYAIYAAAGYGLAVITWVFYLAVMALIPHRHNLRPVAKFHAYLLVGVGLVLDVALNALVASVMFIEPPHPKRMLLTARLSYHTSRDHGWRTSLARWLCVHLLDQFDPRGHHCKQPGA
jgi:hypothetical protein